MEYIEGETLAQRLQKGALPIQQVLQYAIEIADALDKAHRKGITHRDLKPGNIMLTKSGAKLLDFGLAKLRQDAAPATPESQLATMKGRYHRRRNDPGDAAIHGSGAGRSQGSRRAHGHICVWRGGLRNGDGEEGVRGQEPGQPDGQDSGVRAAIDDFAHADDAAGAGSCRETVPGKRSGRALAKRAGLGERTKVDRRRITRKQSA